MMTQPIFSRPFTAAVIGAVLAAASAHVALAQEQVIGHAMGGGDPPPYAGSMLQTPPTLLTGPTLGDLPHGAPPHVDGPTQGQTAAGEQTGSADGDSPPKPTDVAPPVLRTAGPIDAPVLPPVVPPLAPKSDGVPIWAVVLIALAALWLGRKIARGAPR